MRSILVFSAILIIGLTAASDIGIEIVSYNSSNYWHTWNNGKIENQSWFNYSTSQMANGDTITDALNRMQWLTMQYGVATFNNGSPNWLATTDLNAFNVYSFSDNTSYWRLQANYSTNIGRPASLNFIHQQHILDDYVNQTWRLNINGNLNLPNNAYLVEGIFNITFLDTVGVENETWATGRPLTQDAIYYNISSINIMNYTASRGWQYLLPIGKYGNLVSVKNKTIYIALNLGKSISGTTEYSLEKIDAQCAFTCQSPDALIFNVESNTTNIPSVPNYITVRYNVTDSLGLCSMNSQCFWTEWSSDYYNKSLSRVGFQRTNNSKDDGGANWLGCNPQNLTGCTWEDSDGFFFVQETALFKQDQITANRINGNYTAIVFWSQRMQWKHNGVLKGNIVINVNDSTNPKLECSFTNNTILKIPNTNGSNSWANYTPTCNAIGGGLVNNTGYWLNTSGVWSSYDLIDNITGDLNNTMEVENNTYYQYCLYVNQTNYKTSSGYARGTNNTCWLFGINILPAIVPLNVSGLNVTRKPFWRTQEIKPEQEGDKIIAGGNIILWFPLALFLLVLALGISVRDRRQS